MIETGNSPETHFHVSPFLNLYYSLEVSTGTVMEVYHEGYAEKMKKIFPNRILERFKQLHYSQRFSWRLKSCLFDRISEKKLRHSMFLLATEFNEVLNEAFSYYQSYWDTISPGIVSAKEVLEENKNQLEVILAMTSDLLGIPWRNEELHIQLVDPFTGEPVGENVISLGIGSIVSLPSEDLATVSFFFISHEARHILVWDGIRKIAEEYTTEEHAEYIDEAVMNLIRESPFKRNAKLQESFTKAMQAAAKHKFPPPSFIGTPSTPEGKIWKARHEKRNHYIGYYKRLFQNDWEELLARKETVSSLMESLLRRNKEKIEG